MLKIFMLLILVVAMGTTSMAEVPIQNLGNRTTFTTTGNTIAPEYSLFKKFYFNETQLEANAGQEMMVHITSIENRAVFHIYTPLGKTLDGASEGEDTRYWHGILPVSGEYQIVVGATQGHTEFRLKITTQDVPYHTVSPGETLSQIAKHYGYQVSEIAVWNNLPLPYHLTMGQKIRISKPLTQAIQSDSNIRVFLNSAAPKKSEPTSMVREAKRFKGPMLENSFLKILEAVKPVPSKNTSRMSETSTSEASFVKMQEAMAVPSVQPKNTERMLETERDNNASQANFVKMLEALKPNKIDRRSETVERSVVETPNSYDKEEDKVVDKTEKLEVHQKSEAELMTMVKHQHWTYQYTIHPTLPEFTFKLIGKLKNAQHAEIVTIQVYQSDEPVAFQTLSNLNISATVHENELSFKLKDINLDGYQDIILVTTSASQLYVCWIFDPTTKLFVKLILDCGW